MYKGKMTLFYNGEKLLDNRSLNFSPVYNWEIRQTWEVIIVLPGVEVIPEQTFQACWNVKTIIMSDTVTRIENEAFTKCVNLETIKLSRNLKYIGYRAFSFCRNIKTVVIPDAVKRIELCAFAYCLQLVYIKLSTKLEHIGHGAFIYCKSLTSIFIPSSCQNIGSGAFKDCRKLIILSVPQHTVLGHQLIAGNTALIKVSPFKSNSLGVYNDNKQEVNDWIKNVNQGSEQFTLHHECSSCNPPSEGRLYEIVKERGHSSLNKENEIGVTVLEYLRENPFFEIQIDERKLMNKYVLDLMGEITV